MFCPQLGTEHAPLNVCGPSCPFNTLNTSYRPNLSTLPTLPSLPPPSVCSPTWWWWSTSPRDHPLQVFWPQLGPHSLLVPVPLCPTLPPCLQPYVVVVVNIAPGPSVASVPASWALGAYRRLARPFRKNVRGGGRGEGHCCKGVRAAGWGRSSLLLGTGCLPPPGPAIQEKREREGGRVFLREGNTKFEGALVESNVWGQGFAQMGIACLLPPGPALQKEREREGGGDTGRGERGGGALLQGCVSGKEGGRNKCQSALHRWALVGCLPPPGTAFQEKREREEGRQQHSCKDWLMGRENIVASVHWWRVTTGDKVLLRCALDADRSLAWVCRWNVRGK